MLLMILVIQQEGFCCCIARVFPAQFPEKFAMGALVPPPAVLLAKATTSCLLAAVPALEQQG